MQHAQVAQVLDLTRAQSWSGVRRLPALAVLAFGMLLLYGVGFATLPAAHNTAHDTRHANGFPCH